MAKLKNTFSWSFSAASDFEECRRRRYWSKYGMWGGWERNADSITKQAYRLNKMTNRWGLMGVAAENTIMRVLRQHQAGNPISADEAYETVARPFLIQNWKESRGRDWETNPKQFCCLHGHYYGTMGDENAAIGAIREQVLNCTRNFIKKVLPRIGDITREQELPIRTPDMGGDPENITWNGIKMYVIPDYAYRIGNQIHIHDWKAGKIKASHRRQLAGYALWAEVKHGAPIEQIFLYVEYLNEGKVLPFQLSREEFDTEKERIGASVAEMTEYLVDFDRARNEPLPIEDWELAANPESCRLCSFYELCKPDMEEQSK
jgi:CRISPR/Cas system-associated exonuclease Cas4 (RecB family)